MSPTEAIRIMAMHVSSQAIKGVPAEWGNYPELGEYDWNAVSALVNEHAFLMKPGSATFEAAYRLLEERGACHE